MKLTFYGVRGSYPVARKDQIRYGGNTTCLHFQTQSGYHLIVDGGSGINYLGQTLLDQEFGAGSGEAIILVGHTHWDHILGYPFFGPFYQSGNRFTMVSAGQTGTHIRSILSGQQIDLHFPVPFENLSADISYLPIKAGQALDLGEFHIETVQLNHPGITLGYRIEADGCTVAVFTDTARIREIRLGDGMGGPEPDPIFSESFLNQVGHCARQADILVHDTHFLEYEMVGLYNWGHSTIEDALEMARLAQVKQLVLFHYAPEHSDAVIDAQLTLAQDLSKDEPFTVSAAADGLCIILPISGQSEGA